MWVRKTHEEINKEKKTRDYKKILKSSIFLTLFYFASHVFVDRSRFSRFGNKDHLEWEEIYEKIPVYLILGFLVFVFSFIIMEKRNKTVFDDHVTTHICTKCNAKKLDDGKYHCQCGGEFIHIDKMRWVEDGESEDELV